MVKYNLDTTCPWCGDEIVLDGASFDEALGGHSEDCAVFQAEMGHL